MRLLKNQKNMKNIALISLSLFSTFLFFQNDAVASFSTCPESNSYTLKLIERVITEEEYQVFREEAGLQSTNLQELVTLVDSTHQDDCQAIKNDGFYTPEPKEQPVSKTYFKSDNHFFSVVHFSDSIPEEVNDTIKISTGPVGAIKVYDQNFNSVKADLIW